ncbi:hypothetical protein CRG98_003700 [Punica granatum]|uniref:Uncharacterized protein n=1 Tax=Punica granatum TaxID=22663 RepID=A0A2I0L5A6_PUNGR|nr:hypothetical protein CRG98_003700 [Punica granatum]
MATDIMSPTHLYIDSFTRRSLNDFARLTSFVGFSFPCTGKIRNPKGRSPLTDSRLPHVANRALEAPEVVKECPTPSRPTMLKEERTTGDHHQSLHIRRFEPNPERAISHSVFRSKFRSHSGPSLDPLVTFGSVPVIQVHPGLIQSRSVTQVYPGSSAFGSIPIIQVYPGSSTFGSISVSFGSIPVIISRAMSHYIQARHEQPRGSYNRAVAGPKKGRRTCGHRVTNDGRRAGSIRKAEEISRKNLQTRSPENSEVGTVALFITESLKRRKTAPQNGPTGTQGPPRSGNKLQMTFRSSTGFPEGRFSGHERLPVSLRGTSTENRDHNDPRAPQDIRGTLRKSRSQVPRPPRANGQNRLSRRRVARTYVHTTHGDIRLIQTLVVQAFQIYKLIGHRRSDASSIKSQAFSGFSLNRMGPTAQPSQATKPRLNPKPQLNPPSLGSPATSRGSSLPPLRHVRDLSRTPRSAPKESNEPDLAPCRARSSRADPFFPGLPRLHTSGSLTRNFQTKSCDSHNHFPDSFPRTSRLGFDLRTNPFEEQWNDEDRGHDNEADAHELGSQTHEEGAEAQDLGGLHVRIILMMRIVGMTMRLMHTSLKVGLVKRVLKHKILEACMFRVGQSHG